VTYTESAPGAVTSVHSVSFYANNVEAQLDAQLATDASSISSLEAQTASIQASLNTANANVANLKAQVSSLQGQVATLKSALGSAQTTIANLMAENSANASEVATLQTSVTTDLAKIAQLTTEVQTLQSELNAKKNYVAPAWYDTFGTFGIALLVGLVGLVVGVGAYFGGRRVGRKSANPVPGEGTPTSAPGRESSTRASAVVTESAGPRTPESVITRAMTAVAVLQTEGSFDEAAKLTELAKNLAREAHTDPGLADFEKMYR
jgi:hypothetical protein